MEETQQTYLDMGYDANGMALAVQPVQVSANQQDASTDTGSISDSNISGVSLSKVLAGTLAVVAQIGSNQILLDGVNNRIVINDGTVNRIVIGNV